MSGLKRLRSCDKFGASAALNFDGDGSYQTVGGGLASLCVRTLILVYFVMQLIAVATYLDPQISSFKISEDRTKMEEPLTLSDYNQRFYFMFIDGKQAIVPLDSRIGSFKIQSIFYDFLPNGSPVQNPTEVPIKKVDLSDNVDDAKMFPNYGP